MSEIQSIIFNKKIYNVNTAKNWIKKHNFKILKSPDITKNYIRIRQTEPKYKKYYIKALNKNIMAVIGVKKK